MDVELIDNIFSNNDKQEVQFADAQWLYLQDNNNNQYSNYVQFITTTLKNQFIDYHNAYIWMPIRLEIPNTATTAGFAPRPPLIAMRESVLSMFSTIIVSTDQGQTIVNDVNTSMINNLRLKIENNFDWIHCEGSELDFGYDQYIMTPSQTIAPNVGLVGNNSYQQSPSFLAPQGLEPGNVNNSPYTNDANEFGSNLLGSFSIQTNGAGAITGFNGAAAFGAGNGEVLVTFPDGRTGYIPYTATGAGALSSIGGVAFANYVSPNGVYPYTIGTTAVGVAQNNSQPLVSEMVSTPVQFVLTAANTSAGFTNLGGAAVPAAAGTTVIPVSGQIGGRNPNYNKGFGDRVTIFQNSGYYQYYPAGGNAVPSGNANPYGTHVYYYVCKVPLKITHDLSVKIDTYFYLLRATYYMINELINYVSLYLLCCLAGCNWTSQLLT